MTSFGLFLFLEKQVGFYPLMENLTASVLSEVSGGGLIYRRELESSFRIFLGAKEINFSRRIKFSDNIWKRFTTDVYWLDFIFL